MPKSIEELKNAHKGEIAFVLGSGPSLRHADPELLKQGVVIAVNASIIKAPFAQYWFTCDLRATVRTSFNHVLNGSAKVVTFGEVHTLAGEALLTLPNNVSKYQKGEFNATSWADFAAVRLRMVNDRSYKFSRRKDPTVHLNDQLPLIVGSSSAHCALHFARILGCIRIGILGCDCKPEAGKMYFHQFPGFEQDNLIPMPNVHNLKNSRTSLLNLFNITWGHIYNTNKNSTDFSIFDLSGHLPFPKMSLEGFVNEFSSSKTERT